MQLLESLRLRREWGDKPCEHPHIEKEYNIDISTGDEVCTTCGRAITNMFGDKVGPEEKKNE